MIPKGEHVNGDEISMESAGDGSCLKLIEFELQVRIFIFLELVSFWKKCLENFKLKSENFARILKNIGFGVSFENEIQVF